jgi:hypothetical protein
VWWQVAFLTAVLNGQQCWIIRNTCQASAVRFEDCRQGDAKRTSVRVGGTLGCVCSGVVFAVAATTVLNLDNVGLFRNVRQECCEFRVVARGGGPLGHLCVRVGGIAEVCVLCLKG